MHKSIVIAAAAMLLMDPGPSMISPADNRSGEKMTPRSHVKHGKTYAPNGAREVARRLKRANKGGSSE